METRRTRSLRRLRREMWISLRELSLERQRQARESLREDEEVWQRYVEFGADREERGRQRERDRAGGEEARRQGEVRRALSAAGLV